MKQKLTLVVVLLLVGLSPQLAACAGGAPVLPVRESPISADDRQPYWLDNTHVLFAGFTGREFGSGTEIRLLNHGYYVWDLDQNTVTRDARFEHARPECINGLTKSYVIAYAPDGKTWKRRAFVDGQEIALPDRSWVNPFSCRVSTTEPLWVVKGRATRPLLEEHGYLDRGEYGEDSRSKESIRYYRDGVTEPIALGLEGWRVEPLVTYYHFADAYLLKEVPTDAYAPPPLWLLHPNGTLDKIFSPEGKVWAGSQGAGHKEQFSWSSPYVTKRGLFFVETSMPKVDGSEKAGGYILDGDTPRRVVRGFLSWGTVSPDGCRLAFSTNKRQQHIPDEQRFKLQVIDVCQGGGHVN